MNIQKEIADLKGAFAALGEEIKMRFSSEPAKFGELTLVDGTIIKYEGDAPMEGAPLIVVTPEGEVPAPDGVHETDSGLLISTQDGVIVSIEEKEMEVEAGKKEEEMAEFATLESFETYRASVEERMANLEKTLISMLGKVEETFAVFEKFSNQTPAPAEKPFGHTKVEKNEALAGFASAFKNLKK